MKTRTIIILSLFIAATALIAATLTIDIPTSDVPRVSEAYGSILGLGRPATVNEVQAAVKQTIIDTTKDYERRKNTATFVPTPMAMQPTPTPTATGTPGIFRVSSPSPAKK